MILKHSTHAYSDVIIKKKGELYNVRLAKSHRAQRNYFKGHHHTQPSSALQSLHVIEIWAWTYIFTLPKPMSLLSETNRYFSKPETTPTDKSYLEMLSGEQAEMLVSMLSELSRLRVSKAWSL